MYGAIIALVISLMMIALVIAKGTGADKSMICCRKSELYSIAEYIPDDCILEIRIGRKTYEQYPDRKN